MGSGSEAIVFFQNKLNTLKLLQDTHTCIFAIHVDTVLIVLRRPGTYKEYAQRSMSLLPRIYFLLQNCKDLSNVNCNLRSSYSGIYIV